MICYFGRKASFMKYLCWYLYSWTTITSRFRMFHVPVIFCCVISRRKNARILLWQWQMQKCCGAGVKFPAPWQRESCTAKIETQTALLLFNGFCAQQVMEGFKLSLHFSGRTNYYLELLLHTKLMIPDQKSATSEARWSSILNHWSRGSHIKLLLKI